MANEGKGRISGLFNKVRNSKRWFRKNSDLYQAVVDATTEYTKKMSEPVTLESSKELSEIGEKLKKAANDYLSQRKDPRSIEGRARYNYVEQVSKLIRHSDEFRNPDTIKEFQKEGKTLADMVDVERNGKVVDITNQEKRIYGAGASKRIRFKYDGKDGFFTPSEKIDLEKSEIDKIREDNKSQDKDIVAIKINNARAWKIVENRGNKFKAENKELWEKMSNNNLIYRNMEQYINFSLAINEGKTDLECIGIFKTVFNADISKFTEEELKNVIKYHREMSKVNTLVDAMFYADISNLDGLNKRNTAMSRVAGMLGIEDKLAKSTNVKVVDNGNEMEGSFMETAKGIDSRNIEGRNKILSKGEIDLTAGSFQRDINRMQVLDMVCGQVDRHGGNYFYQLSEKPINGKYQITGLQGIDNDMAFGGVNLKRINKQLPDISNLKLIDKDMLNSLNEFTPDKIKFTLGEMLSEAEINAVIDRRQEILIKARSGQLKVVNANEWGIDTLAATKDSLYYKEIEKEITNLSNQAVKENDDIVKDYEAAAERVEAYNKEHIGNEQPMPKKPENYEELKKDIEVREYETKLKEIREYNIENKDTPEELPVPPRYYYEYKEEQAEKYEAEVERLIKEGVNPPKGYNEHKALREAAQRLANNEGIAMEAAEKSADEAVKVSQQAVRQKVSLKEDLAPKAGNSQISPKQSTNEMKKQNNGLGM